MRRTIRVAPVIVLASLALGCSRNAPDPSFTVEAARTFQAEHTATLREPGSPRSVVDAEYLQAPHSVMLSREGRTVMRNDERGLYPVTLAVDDAGLHCRGGCPPEVMAMDPIDTSVDFEWGPFTMRLTPQPVDGARGGRALVIDPQAHLEGPDPSFFPVSADFIVAAKFEPGSGETTALTTSRGVSKPFARAGVLRFSLNGDDAVLHAFRGAGATSGPLLVPFTDPTNERTTYPVGRYLEVDVENGAATLDFNRATNPWCAYSPHFNCPVPPKDNALNTPITAGEQLFEAH